MWYSTYGRDVRTYLPYNFCGSEKITFRSKKVKLTLLSRKECRAQLVFHTSYCPLETIQICSAALSEKADSKGVIRGDNYYVVHPAYRKIIINMAPYESLRL